MSNYSNPSSSENNDICDSASALLRSADRAEAHLDLRGTPCPINFVRTKLRLEQMEPGCLLEVWLDAGEPIEQVPDSLTMEGYKLENIEDRTEFFSLLVSRPPRS